MVHHQGPALYPTLVLDVSCLPTFTLQLLLRMRPSPRSSDSHAPEHNDLDPPSVSSSTSAFICWQAKHYISTVTGAIAVPSSRPWIPQMSWVSVSSFVVGTPPLIPPSASMSPAFLDFPCTYSFPSSPPPDITMTMRQSKIVPSPRRRRRFWVIPHPPYTDCAQYQISQCI